MSTGQFDLQYKPGPVAQAAPQPDHTRTEKKAGNDPAFVPSLTQGLLPDTDDRADRSEQLILSVVRFDIPQHQRFAIR